MVEYLEPVAMKFILVLAVVAAGVAIADFIMLMRYRGTARLKGLLPAIDSILVIDGFMAFTGTCILLAQSAGKIATTNIQVPLDLETIYHDHYMQWRDAVIVGFGWEFALKVLLTMLITAIIAGLLFFVFFEIWVILRFLHQHYMKKLSTSS